MSKSLRSERRRIGRQLDQLWRKQIDIKDLIDTGALRSSFKTKIVKRNKILSIDVQMMYYFQYLDEPFEVSEDLFKTKEYKKLETELIDLITEELFVPIPKKFKSSDTVTYTFKR